ncbi:MAG: hypothetical protein ACQEQD_06715 [Bacillota bacterium]
MILAENSLLLGVILFAGVVFIVFIVLGIKELLKRRKKKKVKVRDVANVKDFRKQPNEPVKEVITPDSVEKIHYNFAGYKNLKEG